MRTLNKVQLLGRLGADPELVRFESGRTLARFSIAVNDYYKPKDSTEWQEVTHWHSITCWGTTAEYVSKLLQKGSKVLVEGKLVTSTYETKEGEKRYATNVEIKDFLIIDGKKEIDSGEVSHDNKSEEDDLPF